MSRCDVCGAQESMPYRCRHCGGTHCAEHRLPEAHDCPGLENWGDPDGVFDSGFDPTVDDRGRTASGGLTDRLQQPFDTRAGGPLAYVRGNMTYTFLGLMWVTFLFQFILYPLAGIGLDSPLWRATFVLTPEHPEYVWTWVTSVFAHGGLAHIAVNSIVIYFFGRLVEQYVGSRNFAALFLVSGVLAGLSQIVIQLVQTVPSGGVLGASGAGLAIMGVLTILNPGLRVYLYFILPVPIWVITIFYAGLSAAGIVGIDLLGPGNTAHAAHLVGLVIGLGYGQRVKDRIHVPSQLQFGSRRGPGGPGGPGGRGPF